MFRLRRENRINVVLQQILATVWARNLFSLLSEFRFVPGPVAGGQAPRLRRSHIGSVRPCVPLPPQSDPDVDDVTAKQRRSPCRPGREAQPSDRRDSRRIRAEGELRRAAGAPEQFSGKDEKGIALGAFAAAPPLSETLKCTLTFQGLKLKKQRSTGDLEKRGTASGSIRSTVSTASWISTGSSQSAVSNK